MPLPKLDLKGIRDVPTYAKKYLKYTQISQKNSIILDSLSYCF